MPKVCQHHQPDWDAKASTQWSTGWWSSARLPSRLCATLFFILDSLWLVVQGQAWNAWCSSQDTDKPGLSSLYSVCLIWIHSIVHWGAKWRPEQDPSALFRWCHCLTPGLKCLWETIITKWCRGQLVWWTKYLSTYLKISAWLRDVTFASVL